MASFNVTQQAHKDYVTQHYEVAVKLQQFEAERAAHAARALLEQGLADRAASSRDKVAARARAGLVAMVPSLDGTLEDPLTDFEAGVDAAGSTNVVHVYTNADVAQARLDAVATAAADADPDADPHVPAVYLLNLDDLE
jgi:hypothetical protein